MQYKILSASLGRDEKIYKQGTYIGIESKEEAEELSSFGCILIEKAKEVEEVKELEEVEEVKEVKHQGRKGSKTK